MDNSLSQIFSLDDPIGRRAFLKRTGITLTSLTLAGTLAEILASCSSVTGPSVTHGTTTIDISKLTADGQFLTDSTVTPDGTPILVIRRNATTYTALSMYCTHSGCQVNTPRSGSIVCTCHNSVFNYDGTVIGGPAPSPLTKYGVALNAAAKTITVTY